MKKTKLLLFLLILILLTFTIIVLVLMNIGIIPTIFKKGEKVKNKDISSDVSKNETQKPSGELGKVDDWCFDPEEYVEETSKSIFSSSITSADAMLESATTNSLGLSVGGAKDVNNFRENIENDYFPLQSDITYEGIYYDYSFDTGNEGKEVDKMFYPTYSTAISKDPFSDNQEYYVSVGLNSNIKEEDFSRKKLNLVLVLDISGSMDSNMEEYYYDGIPDNDDLEENSVKTKMKVAEESINILLDKLNPDDKVGVVLFDDNSYLAKPINLVGDTDIEAIKEHVLEIEAMGGTNFEAGIELAREQFDESGIGDKSEYENRMIIITDAMPNIGETSSSGLKKVLEENSKDGIYSSFIGVGVDFNTDVIKNITDIEGANYYSVSSEEEFNARMGEEFEYMVTPLVFDLNMDVEADGFEIENIYGTDSKTAEDGNIMHINTLFPSKTNDDGEVKGGIIILKLKKTSQDSNEFKINVSYTTRDGEKETASDTVEFKDEDSYYDNSGIRKGILLARYVNVLKNWIEYERKENKKYLITYEDGIQDFILPNNYSSENERSSVELTVSKEYKDIFEKFSEYFKDEKDEIGDENLSKEIDILEKLINM